MRVEVVFIVDLKWELQMASVRSLLDKVQELASKLKGGKLGKGRSVVRSSTVPADSVYLDLDKAEAVEVKGYSIPMPVGLRQKLNLLKIGGMYGSKKPRPYQYHEMYKTLIPYKELRKVVDGRAHLIPLEAEAMKVVTSPILKYDESTGRVETLKRIYIRMEKPLNLDLTTESKAAELKKAEQVLEGADFLSNGFDDI